jgi:hypothetical protein
MKGIIALVLLLLLLAPAGALDITVNKTGSSFIWWSFMNASRDVNITETIYLDNILKADNITTEQFIATGLNPDEDHSITVYFWNWSTKTLNSSYTRSDTTREQDVWFPLYIALACLVIGWFTMPLLIYVGIIPGLYGLYIAFEVTQQSYIVFLYAFITFFIMLAAGLRTFR